jgi:hypothetical protein
LKEKLKIIVETTNKYNLTPMIKKSEGLFDFVMRETSHFPPDRNLSFRAKSVAYDVDCECLYCSKIVKEWGKKFCSNKCYSQHKLNSTRVLSGEEITERLPKIINIDDRTAEKSKQLPQSEVFCNTFNKVYNLSANDLNVLIGFDDCGVDLASRKSNKINLMLSFLIKIAAYQGITEDLFDKCIQVEIFDNKTENMEYYTRLYGKDEALYRLNIKSERVKGDKNPAFQHGGKFSPFSEKFIKGNIREETIKKAHESRESNNSYQSKLSYWTERYGEEDGRRLYHERQRTFSLDKLVDKLGEEEGRVRWEERQNKWLASLDALSEDEKIKISAKKGFWRYASPMTDEMSEGDNIQTKLYVIEYHPDGIDSGRKYIKVGVTKMKYMSDRFSVNSVKEEILIHHSDRYTNFHIERDVKKYIFENNLTVLVESEADKFDGWTECVDVSHKDKLLEVVHEAIRNNTQKI